MNRTRLLDQLIFDEGEVLNAYEDSEGFLTIGVGRLIDKKRGGGITHEESLYLLNNDIERILDEAKGFWWFNELNNVRQEVILNMLFNLGMKRFLGFKLMIKAIEQSEYEWASQEALDSKWSTQVGNRAIRLAEALRKGEW